MSLNKENLRITMQEHERINKEMVDAVKSIIAKSNANKANGKEGK